VLSCNLPVVAVPAAWWPDLGVEQTTQRLIVRASAGQLAHGVHSHIGWS
jgi:hypothetical protein